MSGSLSDLAKFCTGLAKSLPVQINNLSKDVAITIVSDLTEVTPVDTSNALSNWQASLNNPETDEISPYYPGEKGSTQAQSAQAAVMVAENVLMDKKPGQTIYIANNAPYIDDLNHGSSPQQRAGFVERSILLGSLLVGKFKLKVK